MAEGLSASLAEIKRAVIVSNKECSQRGLVQSAKWAAEISYALEELKSSDFINELSEAQDFLQEYDRYILAKSYFDLREYDRAAHFVQSCSSPKVYFLHIYSRYLAGEKKKMDNAPDSILVTGTLERSTNEHLRTLRVELHKKHKASTLDGFCLYLYAVVLKKLDLINEAVEIFVESIQLEPLHWGAWLELSLLITDKEMVSSLALPDHWMKHFFLAHVYLELQLNDEALKMYQQLSDAGFSRSTYVMAQIAVAQHNIREVDAAVEAFGKLREFDPYRLENMDTYSNLLYVKEMRGDLAHLAHQCCDIDKYKVETCCVIGNYYSLRCQHEKAVLYFQRALKLNPNYLSAWTLMGHEYMEIKNTAAAIQAYRQAIEVNKRDYRAWYGLGQTYEIMKMPSYCLYYYKQAQMLRPNDSRMIVALGESYEKLSRLQEAMKCFWKAHSIGDVEGQALVKLAKLYERLGEEEQAASAYTEYINESQRQGTYNPDDQAHAFKYLANFHLKHKNLDEAYTAAHKCTGFKETLEEGKSLLKQISRLRNLNGGGDVINFDNIGLATNERPLPVMDPDNTLHMDRLSPMNLKFTP